MTPFLVCGDEFGAKAGLTFYVENDYRDESISDSASASSGIEVHPRAGGVSPFDPTAVADRLNATAVAGNVRLAYLNLHPVALYAA